MVSWLKSKAAKAVASGHENKTKGDRGIEVVKEKIEAGKAGTPRWREKGDELKWSEDQWEDVMGMWGSLRWMEKNPRRGGVRGHFCTSTESKSLE